jgi:phosphatidylserine/phosphatidylglycerophosphate/cardiolipin synthase-like enzyme
MDTDEARNLLFNLIQNSKYHIDMTIPTCNLSPLVTERLSNYLKTAINQGVKVRILIPNELE